MEKLIQSSSPHVHCGLSARRVMLDVVLALLPACVAAVVIFGLPALWILCVCVGSAVIAEALFDLIARKPQTIGDLSAVVTGILLALNLSTNVPLWQCAVGAVFAIVVVKCLFGGLGYNFANPAITARVFMLIAFASVAGGANPTVVELTASATPLVQLSAGGAAAAPSLMDLFLGLHGGTIGETCILALVLGYIYLVARKVIKWYVPAVFVGTVFACYLAATLDAMLALKQILAGGLFLGAIFMATDYVTTPITSGGRVAFALGCGLITFVIRYYCKYPEGVSFSILAMNILTPFLEKYTAHWPMGGSWGGRKKRHILRSALCLAVLLAVLGAALTGLNTVTAPIIEKNAAQAQTGLIYQVMPDAEGFEMLYSAATKEESALHDVPDTVRGIFKETSGKGYGLLLSTTKGYTGDPMEITLAVNGEGKIIDAQVTAYPESKDFGVDTYPKTYVGQDSTLAGVSLAAGVTYSSAAFKGAVEDAFAALIDNGLVQEAVKSDAQLLDELLPKAYPGMANAAEIIQADEATLPEGQYPALTRALVANNGVGVACYAAKNDKNYLVICNASGGCRAYDVAGNDVTAQADCAELIDQAKAFAATAVEAPAKAPKKLLRLVDKNAEAAPIALDNVFSTVKEAYAVQFEGKDYYGFVAEAFSYGNEVMEAYYMLDSQGAIVGMNVKTLIFHAEYFHDYQLEDEGAYKEAFAGLTADTWQGDQALVTGATFTTTSVRTATDDVFAAFQAILANGGNSNE